MTNKHTPGPWFIMDREIDELAVVISGSPFYDGHPDPLYHVGVTGENAEADANLIAAAPELLEEVKVALVCAEVGLVPDATTQARFRAAIAKAKGQA